MDHYVVRVYWRDAEDQTQLAGLAERVRDGEKRAFGSRDDLWAFLIERAPRGSRGQSPGKRGPAARKA